MPDADTSSTPPIRLSISLPGGASLGAYEAGATAAVCTAVTELRARNRPVTVDAMGGASAGALVSLIASHCLLEGLDAAEVLHRAWVDEVSLELLRGRDGDAPLSYDRLRRGFGDVLAPDGTGRQPPLDEPLAFQVALTALRGLSYEIGPPGSSSTALTYADGMRFVLHPGGGFDQLVTPPGRAPLDAALASAAHPAGFRPHLLDRSGDADVYRTRGITDLPPDPRLWYVDGGLVQTEPIGKVLAAARELAAGRAGPRLHVMVDPRNEDPSGARAWGDPATPASWTAALARAVAIVPSQVLYDDLRGIEADNDALARVDAVTAALAPALASGAGLEALCDALAAAGHDPGHVEGDGRDLLRHLLAHLAGVDGKEPVEVALVSPLLVARPDDRAVPALLAGEFLGTFGGFLRRELRESDFALGWRSTLAWLPEGLARVQVPQATVSAVVTAVDDRRERSWREVNRGEVALSGLPLAARVTLARLALHTLRVVAAGKLRLPGLRAIGPGRSSRRRPSSR